MFECEGDLNECEWGDLSDDDSDGIQRDDLDRECQRNDAKWDENVVTGNEMLDNTIIRKLKNEQDGDDTGGDDTGGDDTDGDGCDDGGDLQCDKRR